MLAYLDKGLSELLVFEQSLPAARFFFDQMEVDEASLDAILRVFVLHQTNSIVMTS